MLSRIIDPIRRWAGWLWGRIFATTDSGKPVPPNNDISSALEEQVDGDNGQRTESHKHLAATDENGSDPCDQKKSKPKGNDKPASRQPKTPPEIGGRRKRNTSISPRNGKGKPKEAPSGPRAQLICLKEQQQWGLHLSAVGKCLISEVQQCDEPLTKEGDKWSVPSFRDSLSISYEDRKGHHEIKLFGDKPLVFKLQSGWKGTGRKVRGITSGHFVVIAPKEWHRTGNAPVEQKGCTNPDFTAHYFFRETLNEEVDGFKECADLSTNCVFELCGNNVFDDSEEGELFGVEAPKLKPSTAFVWARIGEEKEEGWRGDNFKPAERLLTDVLAGRQGRFFLRVYDADSKLLDSGEFRYFADLKSILVNGAPYSGNSLLVPPLTGHSSTEVRFVGADDKLVRAKLETDGPRATMRTDDTVVVEPHPDGDALSCILGSGDASVHVDIKLPRIWWQRERNNGARKEWCDTPLTMTRQEFRSIAHADEKIRFRVPAHVSSVNVGFDEELDRTYRPGESRRESTPTQRLIGIPLIDFVDYSQIDQRLNEDALFKVRCGEATLMLIRVSADPIPIINFFTCEPTEINEGETTTLSWETRNAEPSDVVINLEDESVKPSGSFPVTPHETTTFTLKLSAPGMDDVTKNITVTVHPKPAPEGLIAVVKCRNEYRRGKGFSHGEVRAVGLTVANAARLPFPFDKRRRSTHQVNIEMIQRHIDA